MPEVTNNNGKKPEEKSKDIFLSIRMSKDKGLEVGGPGDGTVFDEPMCFWLLEKAKDYIKNHNTVALKSKIVRPKHGIMEFVRGGKR